MFKIRFLFKALSFESNVFHLISKESRRNLHINSVLDLHATDGRKTARNGIDIESLYIRRDVQNILKDITEKDTTVAYGRRTLKKIANPSYSMLTEEQLAQLNSRTTRFVDRRLQLPPYLEDKPDVPEMLSENPEMDGYLEFKHIFVDISANVPRENRLVVARDTHGILRLATREEKSRMLQIFYPLDLKFSTKPKIFEPKALEALLSDKRHVNLLERACVQFEPDSSDFIQVTRYIYEDVEKRDCFELIYKTRFIGAAAFHLTVNRRIDRLLVFFLQQERVDRAAKLLQLYTIIHPDTDDNIMEHAKRFCRDTGMLEQALKQCQEKQASHEV